jgi:polysaccharide deacetylase family protein (PEP-CTERM system associated)
VIARTQPQHALTIDVEDYFQVTALDKCVQRADWSRLPSRVLRNTCRVLDLLARTTTRATFFVLGWVAQHHPQVVREIQAAGHEIGSHSYWHHLVYTQTPAEFRSDLRRSRDVLEDLTGHKITHYRAPTFSITAQSLWALDILTEEGFTLDASIFPIRHDRYGIPDAPRQLHRRSTATGHLWEFPPTVASFGRIRLPVGGGGYFRLMPLSLTRRLWRRCQRESLAPRMFYFHPWEIDSELPRVAGMSRLNAWRHHVNVQATERKLETMLREFRFGAIGDVLTDSAGVATPLVMSA